MPIEILSSFLKDTPGNRIPREKKLFVGGNIDISHDKTKLDSMFRNVEFYYQCIA